jgi:hypothetical protein
MRHLLLPIVASFVLAAPALAAGAPQQDTSPQQALVQMLQEAQGREAQALVQVYALRTQVALEKQRADEAEAKLKASSKAEPAPKP